MPSTNPAAVDAAILAQLSADAELAALVNGAFYMDLAPENLTRFVLVTAPIHLDEPMQPGATAFEQFEYWVQAVITGKSVADADDAEARILAALHFQQFPIEGYALMVSRRLGRIAYSDRDDAQRVWRHRGARFEVMVHEQAAPPPPSAYADLVLADGPIHYWRLNETTGAVVGDAVGVAAGAIVGGVTLGQPGPLDDGSTAMTFDGSTGTVQIATVTLPPICTIELWVKPTATPLSRPLMTWGAGQNPAVYTAPASGPKIIGAYYDVGGNGNTSDGVTGINALAPGAWHHLAYVFDGSIVALYADAVFDVSKSMIRVSANANTVQIGGDPAFGSGPQAFSDASLAEVAVYPLALTPTQIAAHYNARTTGARSRRVLGT